MDMRLEVVVIGVSDVDRAKAFYDHGWFIREVTMRLSGPFEAVAPKHDWWDWYAAYMSAREQGSGQDEAAESANRYMADVKHIVVP